MPVDPNDNLPPALLAMQPTLVLNGRSLIQGLPRRRRPGRIGIWDDAGPARSAAQPPGHFSHPHLFLVPCPSTTKKQTWNTSKTLLVMQTQHLPLCCCSLNCLNPQLTISIGICDGDKLKCLFQPCHQSIRHLALGEQQLHF